jgi:hypothetical protein
MDSPVAIPAPLPEVPPQRSIPSWIRFIHDRNPFFLLSALSMFAGYRIVLGAINSAPGDLRHLLLLISILQVYEALLIGLGLFHIVRRGLQRDGWFLLGIEALFLVDLTNLNAEFFTADQHFGSIVNGVCFLLAIAKILVVVRTLDLRLSAGTVLFIATQLACLFGLPGVFKQISHHAAVSPMQIYGVWWALALLIVAGSLLVRAPVRGGDSPMAPLPWRLYVVVPFLSLLVHLCGENRVYAVAFQPANLAPIALALAVVINRSTLRRTRFAWACAVLAVLFAVLLSSPVQGYERLLIAHVGHVAVSPLRLCLLASAAMMTWLASQHAWMLAVQVATACAALAMLGANWAEMIANATRLVRWTLRLLRRAIPETPLQWGYLAIAMAFVLLGVGAIVSLRKPAAPSSDSSQA